MISQMVSRFVFRLQVEDVAQGRLQGEQLGPGGPQQVGKHATDLFNPEMKFEYSIQFIF